MEKTMPTVEELRRRYEVAKKISENSARLFQRVEAEMLDAMRRDAMAELAARGIVPGSRVKCSRQLSPEDVFMFDGLGSNLHTMSVCAHVRVIKADGTAANWICSLRPQDIVLAEEADNA